MASWSFLPALDAHQNFKGDQKMPLEFLFPQTGIYLIFLSRQKVEANELT